MKAISEHFENLNKMEIDKIEESFHSVSHNNSLEGRSMAKRGSPSGVSNLSANGVKPNT